jgi:NAD(P)-dependent dehydrogenase (short-subunit alcohol dehydrogenase family)
MTTPATGRRVWLITGATSGFGRSLAEEVLRQGDIVVGAGRTISPLDDLKGAYPDQLFPVVLDVTDTERDAEVVGETVQRHGRLDVLVNNAAGMPSTGSASGSATCSTNSPSGRTSAAPPRSTGSPR